MKKKPTAKSSTSKSKSKTKTGGKSRKNMSKKTKTVLVAAAAVAVLLPVLLVLLFVTLIKVGTFGPVPSLEDIYKHKNFEQTRVYASGGELVGSIYKINRSNVAFSKIPKHIINALVATEDSRFFEHEGVDFVALSRVFLKTLLARSESSGGGSTISQQLAKNLYPRKRYPAFSMAINKIREMIVASRIEELYTKEEILALYLNTVSFGENVYGIENASLRYFSRHCHQLTVEQGAVLVGTLKANTIYNPRINHEKSRNRRNTVLRQMLKYGYLDAQTCEKLCEKPMVLQYMNISEYARKSGYFLDFVKEEATRIINDYNAAHNTQVDILTDGLMIYTTLDYNFQQAALRAVDKHVLSLQWMANKQIAATGYWASNKEFIDKWRHQRPASAGSIYQKQPMSMGWGIRDTVLTMSPLDSFRYVNSRVQAAVLATDPRSGAIKVWIGGINYLWAPFNRVLSKRQVGSTFKPIVYYTALSRGVDPCEKIPNEREVYPDYNNWSPQNADSVYGGFYTMKGGLAKSVNTITAKLMFMAGIDNVVATARKLGITSDIPSDPSIALGTPSISLFEMVNAYAVFANRGRAYSNYAITRITDAKGKVLYSHSSSSRGQVLDADLCEKLTDIMTAVADSGTARRLREKYHFDKPVACKTGTTQDNTDGWFIGFTPRVSMGVWVGFDNPALHFNDTKIGQGANTSLPIWAMSLQGSFAGKYEVPFYLDPENCVSCRLFYPDRSDIRQERKEVRRQRRQIRDSLKEVKKNDRKMRRKQREEEREAKRAMADSTPDNEKKKKNRWWPFGR